MVALGTMYSFTLFSSLNNLNPASLTGTLRVGKETFLKDFFSCTVLLPCVLQLPHPIPKRGGRKGRAEPNAHTALPPRM